MNIDGWNRPVTRRGTCKACGRTDAPVGASGRLLSHDREIRPELLTSCYWTGRKATDVRESA